MKTETFAGTHSSTKDVGISGPRPIWRLGDLDDVDIGDRVILLGSYELTWDEDCLKPAELEPWRFEGDPLCDEVVRALNLRAGMDGLDRIQQHMKLPEAKQRGCVREFWQEISQLPPGDLSALPPLAQHFLSTSSSSSPATGTKARPDPSLWPTHEYTPIISITEHNHHPPPILAQGQAVFWRYSAQIFASLLHFSLAGGFAAERIMGVLHETGYLVGGPAAAARGKSAGVGQVGSGAGTSAGGPSAEGAGVLVTGQAGACPATGVAAGVCPVMSGDSAGPTARKELGPEEIAARDQKERDRTYHRLLETTQAVMDYMYDMTPITGAGWQNAIRVRMLHSAVRVRLADKRGVRNVYDAAVDGVPINQEDMIMTLGSFAMSPIYAMRRMGFYLTNEEEDAYCAAWRHVGYYLGISPAKLSRHFSSAHRAERLSACTTMHLFSYDATSPFGPDGLPKPATIVDPTSTSTYRLLQATSDRAPFFRPIGESLCLARILLGEGMADRLALPQQSWVRRTRTVLGFRAQRFIHAFGRFYKYRIGDLVRPAFWLTFTSGAGVSVSANMSSGDNGAGAEGYRHKPYSWETERIESTRLLIDIIIFWQMGRTRAGFTVNEHVLIGEEANDEKDAVDAEKEQLVDDEAEKAKHQLDAKKAIRHFRGLMIEMGVVLAGIGGLGVAAGYLAWRATSAYLG